MPDAASNRSRTISDLAVEEELHVVDVEDVEFKWVVDVAVVVESGADLQ